MSDLLQMILVNFGLVVTPLAIFITACIYIFKKAKIDSILLFLGSLVGLITSAVSLIIVPSFIRSKSLSSLEIEKIYIVIGFVSFFGGICFAVGFFMLVIDTIKNKKAKQNNFQDNDIIL